MFEMKCFQVLRLVRRLVAVAVFVGLACVAHAADIQGAGATFPYPIYAKWAEAYKRETGVGLNYQPIGSGGGIKQIKAKTVIFGASDMPLKFEELRDAGLAQWPMVVGGVVPIVNVPGAQNGSLVLDGSTLAKIYLGAIVYWDDRALVALNPGLKLPHLAIAPVYRSDGSGTTFLFTSYLKAVNADFADKIGSNASVPWVTGMGAKGNVGVATMVGQTEGALGYVEYAYAMGSASTHYAKMVNRAGEIVEPSIDSFQSAATHANWSAENGFHCVLVNEAGKGSWPMAGASFILMHMNSNDMAATRRALDFFSWAYDHGAEMARDMSYVPIPDAVIHQVKESWKPLIERR